MPTLAESCREIEHLAAAMREPEPPCDLCKPGAPCWFCAPLMTVAPPSAPGYLKGDAA